MLKKLICTRLRVKQCQSICISRRERVGTLGCYVDVCIMHMCTLLWLALLDNVEKLVAYKIGLNSFKNEWTSVHV